MSLLTRPHTTNAVMPRESNYNESDVVNSLYDVIENGFSQFKAAQKHGIPQSTISRRLNGSAQGSEQIQPFKHLSNEQEARLCQWIVRQESLGYALSHNQLKGCVLALVNQLGMKNGEIGSN